MGNYGERVTAADAVRVLFDARKWVLPSWQRDYVWTPRQVVAFWDSVLKGYPLGMLVIWQPYGCRGVLLDGQQRVSTLLGRRLVAIDGAARSGIVPAAYPRLDKDGRLTGVTTRPKPCWQTPLHEMRLDGLRLPGGRPISLGGFLVVDVEDEDPDVAAEIFCRVTTGGVRIKPADVRKTLEKIHRGKTAC